MARPLNVTAIPSDGNGFSSSSSSWLIEVSCRAPSLVEASSFGALEGPVGLRVVLAGHSSLAGAVFRYDPLLNITRVSPGALVTPATEVDESGAESGLLAGAESTTVIVSGVGFRASATARCRFRRLPSTYLRESEPETGVRVRGLPSQAAMAAQYQEFETAAMVLSVTEARCSLPRGAKSGGFGVSISLNAGHDYSYDTLDAEVDGSSEWARTGVAPGAGAQLTGALVIVLERPRVHGVRPLHGPLGGGTVVRLHGRGLVPRASTGAVVKCAFGSLLVDPLRAVAAPQVPQFQELNDADGVPDGMDEIICVAPPVQAGSVAVAGGIPGADGAAVPVGVSVDGGESTFDSGFTFEYSPDAALLGALPARAGAGEDLVVTVRLRRPLMESSASALRNNAFSSLLSRAGRGRVLDQAANASNAAYVGFS